MKQSHLFRFSIFAAICSLACALNACHDDPAPDPAPAEADATVLVYMVATNDLGSRGYDKLDIKEMQQAAQSGHIAGGRLLVYNAPYSGPITLTEITAKGIDTIRTYSADTLSVDASRMAAVIADAKKRAPAKSYGMVLWSHASGWLEDGIADVSPSPKRSFGVDRGKRMNTTSLAGALEGEDMDFLYFDCCYMGSVESAYELRRAARHIIASPTEDPLTGMPYHLSLKHLFKADYVGAAKAMFDFYHATYAPGSCPVSISVINTDKLDALASATRDIYAQASANMPEGYSPQPYSLSPYYYYDLEDYAKALAGGADEPLFIAWKAISNEAIEYAAAEPSIWGSIPLTRFGGLSTFIYDSEDDYYFSGKNYKSLSWYADVASSLPAASL